MRTLANMNNFTVEHGPLMTILFTMGSLAGNLITGIDIDSLAVLHFAQIIATLVGIAVGVKTLLGDKKKK